MLFNKRPHEDVTPASVEIEAARPESINAAKPRKIEGAATRSVIDPWLRITGNIEGEAELQIDGYIRGDIRCTKLVVGKAATVDGNVTAEEIIIRGRVTGIVRGGRVVLQEGASVRSEIYYKRLCIEEDALFDGVIHMRENPLEDRAPAAPEAKSARKPKARTDEVKAEAEAVQPSVQIENQPKVEYPTAGGMEELLEAQSDLAAMALSPVNGSEIKRLRAQMRDRRSA